MFASIGRALGLFFDPAFFGVVLKSVALTLVLFALLLAGGRDLLADLVHVQRLHLADQVLQRRRRQRAGLVAEEAQGRLQVERRRVVRRRRDARLGERRADAVALRRAADEEVVDVVAVGRRRSWGDHVAAGQPLAQCLGGVAAPLVVSTRRSPIDAGVVAWSGRASRITRYWLVSVKIVETMRWP